MESITLQTRKGQPSHGTLPRAWLVCGIFSSLLYVVMNVVAAMLYEGYHSASQTVSELSAVDAPTRPLWVSLAVLYSLLVIAFGWGVWQSAAANRLLRMEGALFIVNAIIGFFWPPMHQREVLAAGGGTLTDILHIVFTAVWGVLAILSIGLGAAALGKRFRLYSMATLVILLTFGILTGIESPKIQANQPTPWIGVWECINIGVFMLWNMVLAITLLKAEKKQPSPTTQTKGEMAGEERVKNMAP